MNFDTSIRDFSDREEEAREESGGAFKKIEKRFKKIKKGIDKEGGGVIR